MTGLVRADGGLAWWDAIDKGPNCLPVVGRFTGRTSTEAIGIGYDDGIRCYDAATGAVVWQMQSPVNQAPTGMAAADIDSDGCDEALFTQGAVLDCIGAAVGASLPRGELRWKIELPATVGPPAIADMEGDGQASIVLVGSDGYVYGVR